MKQVEFLCIENDAGVILPDVAEVQYFRLKELEAFLVNSNLTDRRYVLSVTDKYAVVAANLAIKYGVFLSILGEPYEFVQSCSTKITWGNLAMELISNARHEQVLKAACIEALEWQINDVPIRRSYDEITINLRASLINNKNLKSDLASKVFDECVSSFFCEKQAYVKGLLMPAIGGRVKQITMAYDDKLTKWIAKNPAIYVLNGRMGSKKTKNVIKPLFDQFCQSGDKPVLIAPTVALTHKLFSDERNYQNADFTDEKLSGLASCIISATTKQQSKVYSDKSKVTLIEEFEECESSLTKAELIRPHTLRARVTAFSHWYKLLAKPTVVIADATFSNFSAQQLVKAGRDVVIVTPPASDLPHPQKEVCVFSENSLINQMKSDLESGDRVVNFCDGAQSNNGKADRVFKNVSRDVKDTVNVNKTYMSGAGTEYLNDIKSTIEAFQYHQYSPVITSGISIEAQEIKKICITSCKTLLPTQLIQSAGRFRAATKVNLSFDNTKRFEPISVDSIFRNEYLVMVDSYDEVEVQKLKGDSNCKRLIERIQHINRMYQNYEFNVLTMFEFLGYEVSGSATNRKSLSLSKSDKQATWNQYCFLIEQQYDDLYLAAQSHGQQASLIEAQINQSSKFNECLSLLRFYRFPRHYNQLMDLLTFDDFGKGRVKINNYINLNDGESGQRKLTDKINAAIVKQILQVLGICPVKLEGQYKTSDIHVLFEFISTGSVNIEGRDYRVLERLRCDHPYFRLSKNYKDKIGNLSSNVFNYFFGIKQRAIRSGGKNEEGKRPILAYELEPNSRSQFLNFFHMHRFGDSKVFSLNEMDTINGEEVCL